MWKVEKHLDELLNLRHPPNRARLRLMITVSVGTSYFEIGAAIACEVGASLYLMDLRQMLNMLLR